MTLARVCVRAWVHLLPFRRSVQVSQLIQIKFTFFSYAHYLSV